MKQHAIAAVGTESYYTWCNESTTTCVLRVENDEKKIYALYYTAIEPTSYFQVQTTRQLTILLGLGWSYTTNLLLPLQKLSQLKMTLSKWLIQLARLVLNACQ